MAGKLIMNKGLPRSGKSTWAKEFLKASGNAVIISRDMLREMLHDNKWTPRNEKTTIAAQKALATSMLKEGKVVIIDDTNLTESHRARWEAFAKEHDAGFEIHHEKEADIVTLIERDNASDTKRGHEVITKLALENGYIDFPKRSVIVCDIDGTIADCNHRRKYSHGPEKDWDMFFRLAPKDDIIKFTEGSLRGFHQVGKTIIFVSARPERCRKDTEDWLYKYGFYNSNVTPNLNVSGRQMTPYFALLMRPDGDSRDDVLVKQQILDRQLKKEWIDIVLDDRPKVIRMWRSNGLDVVDVGDGIDF